jgi:hypothetical protein
VKKGDKVYAARTGWNGVTLSESTVAAVYTRGRLKIATREDAWCYRLTVAESQCHPTRREALVALLASERVSLDVVRDRIAHVEAALAKEPQP